MCMMKTILMPDKSRLKGVTLYNSRTRVEIESQFDSEAVTTLAFQISQFAIIEEAEFPYVLGRRLGSGLTSGVYEGFFSSDITEVVAVKEIKKKKLKEPLLIPLIVEEVKIQRSLRGLEGVVQVGRVYENKTRLLIVMEL